VVKIYLAKPKIITLAESNYVVVAKDRYIINKVAKNDNV